MTQLSSIIPPHGKTGKLVNLLANEEKNEMLADARDKSRCINFKISKVCDNIASMDDYIMYLNDIQAIFGPFKLSKTPIPSNNFKL